MPLTDTAIRNARPGVTPKGQTTDKPYKMGDAGGLYLEVPLTGAKRWRLKYRYGGKEKRLSLGTYPDVPLASPKGQDADGAGRVRGARELRDEARQLIANGIDPSEYRKATKAMRIERAGNSFEAVALEWYEKQKPTWNAAHGDRIIRRLKRDIFPWIGGRPVAEITAPELLAALRRIENRGRLETAHRALQNCGQVMRYAIATGRAERDPSSDLRGALPPVKGTHFAAVTDPKAIGALLRKLDGHQGTLTVGCALRLAPLVFVRPGELRHAEWADIDLEAADWRFTVSKTGTAHIVPLSTQAVAILRELQALSGHGRYVFPGARSHERPMSENAVLAALRSLEIGKDEMSGHGFRAMARTVLDEVMGMRPDLIEHQLAHAVKDPNGRAYNRTAHLPERVKMMQAWSDWLDRQKAGAEVIELRPKTA